MKVYNSSKNIIIADDVKVAKNLFTRSVGLLSRSYISSDEGLVIKPCCSIHTFFMKFTIDVLFVNKKNEIIAVYQSVVPNRILPIHLTSSYVIELSTGQILDKKIEIRDIIQLIQ